MNKKKKSKSQMDHGWPMKGYKLLRFISFYSFLCYYTSGPNQIAANALYRPFPPWEPLAQPSLLTDLGRWLGWNRVNNKISGVRGIESKKNLFLFFTSVERNHRVGLVKVFVSVKQTRKNYNSKIDNKKKKKVCCSIFRGNIHTE